MGTSLDKSIRTPRGSTICDEDELFLTPTQGSADESSQKKPTSSLEDSNARLNETFDKPEPSMIEARANGTFDKEPSVVVDPSIVRSSCKSPDFDLRLDSTCQQEDSKIVSSRLAVEQMSTPVRREPRGSFTYRGIGEKDCEAGNDRKPTSDERHEDAEDPEATGRRSSSSMKRPCSILELSFVTSPKRGNFQVTTPKGTDQIQIPWYRLGFRSLCRRWRKTPTFYFQLQRKVAAPA